MAEQDSNQIFETIGKMETHKSLERLEANIRRLGALTDDVEQALKDKYKLIGRALVAARTGLDLSCLSEPEEKIVLAVSEYVGLQRRAGKNSQRTLKQLKNRGLIGAAEVSVMKSKPTQGYEVLHDADKEELSYERIIVDHPDYFTPRAHWYARKTLEIGNPTERPPAASDNPTQGRCELLISWLYDRSIQNGGSIPPYTNDEAASAVGMDDMQRFGRVQGNIQSRLDFACYAGGLPPMGLTDEHPFPEAWSQQERNWAFQLPICRKQHSKKFGRNQTLKVSGKRPSSSQLEPAASGSRNWQKTSKVFVTGPSVSLIAPFLRVRMKVNPTTKLKLPIGYLSATRRSGRLTRSWSKKLKWTLGVCVRRTFQALRPDSWATSA